MTRRIIEIDEDKCCGCGLCAKACHEGAIGMVDGKAKLLHDNYCDGLGNCLPVCPKEAISFKEVEAAGYSKPAAKNNMESKESTVETLACGCPGTHSKSIDRDRCCETGAGHTASGHTAAVQTHLNQWPVQIKLVPPNAPYFSGANLLVAADCTAFAYGNFHAEYMKNKVTIIGCPKLDDEDYSQKLTAILQMNEIKSVTVVRMEVPCCSGIETFVKNALKNSGKLIPWQIVVISTDGRILEQ